MIVLIQRCIGLLGPAAFLLWSASALGQDAAQQRVAEEALQRAMQMALTSRCMTNSTIRAIFVRRSDDLLHETRMGITDPYVQGWFVAQRDFLGVAAQHRIPDANARECVAISENLLLDLVMNDERARMRR